MTAALLAIAPSAVGQDRSVTLVAPAELTALEPGDSLTLTVLHPGPTSGELIISFVEDGVPELVTPTVPPNADGVTFTASAAGEVQAGEIVPVALTATAANLTEAVSGSLIFTIAAREAPAPLVQSITIAPDGTAEAAVGDPSPEAVTLTCTIIPGLDDECGSHDAFVTFPRKEDDVTPPDLTDARTWLSSDSGATAPASLRPAKPIGDTWRTSVSILDPARAGEYAGTIAFGEGDDAPSLALTAKVRWHEALFWFALLFGVLVAALIGPIWTRIRLARTLRSRITAAFDAHNEFHLGLSRGSEDPQPDPPAFLAAIRDLDGEFGDAHDRRTFDQLPEAASARRLHALLGATRAVFEDARWWDARDSEVAELESSVADWALIAPRYGEIYEAYVAAQGEFAPPSGADSLDGEPLGDTWRLLGIMTRGEESDGEGVAGGGAAAYATRLADQAVILVSWTEARNLHLAVRDDVGVAPAEIETALLARTDPTRIYRAAPSEAVRSRQEGHALLSALHDAILLLTESVSIGTAQVGEHKFYVDLTGMVWLPLPIGPGRGRPGNIPRGSLLIRASERVATTVSWLTFAIVAAATLVAYAATGYGDTWGGLSDATVAFAVGVGAGGLAIAWDQLPFMRQDVPKDAAA